MSRLRKSGNISNYHRIRLKDFMVTNKLLKKMFIIYVKSLHKILVLTLSQVYSIPDHP